MKINKYSILSYLMINTSALYLTHYIMLNHIDYIIFLRKTVFFL